MARAIRGIEVKNRLKKLRYTVFEQILSGEAVEEGEVELQDGEDHVLVEEVENHLGSSDVAPASVHQQQAPETLELAERLVARLHSTHALISVYPAA